MDSFLGDGSRVPQAAPAAPAPFSEGMDADDELETGGLEPSPGAVEDSGARVASGEAVSCDRPGRRGRTTPTGEDWPIWGE
eukprot:5991227-Alexandrium_andersonii.AAC.1